MLILLTTRLRLPTLLALAVAVAANVLAGDPTTQLWYDKPAANWETEALPIGNGHVGAMSFGGLQHERIQFNEGSLWIGDENDTGAFQAFGDVHVTMDHADGTHYRRELDLRSGVHSVSYESGGVQYRREYFASSPARAVVLQFTADRPSALTGTIALTDTHGGKLTAESSRLMVSGSLERLTYDTRPKKAKDKAPAPEASYALALQYEAQLVVRHDGGSLAVADGKIAFNGANSVTLYLDAGTDFLQDRGKGWRGVHPHRAITDRLAAATSRSYEKIREEHVKDVQGLFDRVALDLGPTERAVADLPTDRRLLNYGKGAASDHALEVLLFHYGRYLLIGSSRAGTLPANLQGKWNQSNQPPWRSDYHTDINVQMNYWPADVANLSECFSPYAEWLNSIREVRKAATRQEFHTRGWTMRAENGIFGGSTWQWVESGSAWCMQNLWDHYAFTGDKAYLRTRAYPMMKEVCEFWLDRLKALPDGTLVAPNGYSPEHGPREDGVSHDQQLVWDLFNSTVEAADALSVDRAFRDDLAAKRDRLLGPKIGKWGQLQEWMVDRDDPKDNHRHLSHLVAVHPGRQITPRTTPELAAAAAVSLNARGDRSTGWSTAWKINLWARLHDGDRAYKLIGNLLHPVGETQVNFSTGGGVYSNLFDAHPPFQIDGNFGYTAGVCEMLLQSHAGEIELLPALPRAWPTGRVTGLRARGGFTIDIEWREGKVTRYRVSSAQPHKVKIRVNGALTTVTSEKPAPGGS